MTIHPGNTRRHDGTQAELTRWVLDHGGDVLNHLEDGTVVVASTWGPQHVEPGYWVTCHDGHWATYGPMMMTALLRSLKAAEEAQA